MCNTQKVSLLQPLYWLSSPTYNQSCCSPNTVRMRWTCVSKPVCTGSSTTYTAIVISVVLPGLPVLKMPALFLVDTAQSVRNCELPYMMAWGVTYLLRQMSDHTEVTAIAVNMLHTRSRWIFPYTHRKTEQITNKPGLLQMPAFSSTMPFVYYVTFTVHQIYSRLNMSV